MSMHQHKILVGINDLFVGGAQRLVVDVLSQPAFADAEVHLVTFLDDIHRESFRSQLPASVQYHHIPFTHYLNPLGWWGLFRLLAEVRPQAVWTHFFFANTVYRMLQPFFGYRVVAVEHNTYTWKRWHHRVVDRLLARLTHRIVAVSSTVATFTSRQEGIPFEKFVVIPNGVNVQKIREDAAAMTREEALHTLGLPSDRRYLVNVARLSRQKNHRLLLDAFAKFSSMYPDYTLLIVGDGPERVALEQYAAASGLAERVRFLGIQMDVVPCYCASDFFVLTSTIEGFALVCIEAMACGLPVISTRVAGPDEYVWDGENGFLVPAEPAAVAEKMKILARMTPAEREILGDAARLVAEQYSVAVTAQRYYTLLV